MQILGGGFHELIPGGAEVRQTPPPGDKKQQTEHQAEVMLVFRQVPAEASQRFSLSHNGQREVCIVVLEAAGDLTGQPNPGAHPAGCLASRPLWFTVPKLESLRSHHLPVASALTMVLLCHNTHSIHSFWRGHRTVNKTTGDVGSSGFTTYRIWFTDIHRQ